MVAALRGEGVTYSAHALATLLANDFSTRVCLVDLNWWWPSHSPLAPPDAPGLAAVLTDETNLDEVIVETGWHNLSYLPAGILAKHDRPMLSRSQELREIMDKLSARFDHLVMDIPAVLATTDAV